MPHEAKWCSGITARNGSGAAYHTELELIAENMAREILKERLQIRDLMGQLIEVELRTSLRQCPQK